MLFQRKHLLAASQMEAPRHVEITGMLVGNVELDGGAHRAKGGWLARGGRVHMGAARVARFRLGYAFHRKGHL